MIRVISIFCFLLQAANNIAIGQTPSAQVKSIPTQKASEMLNKAKSQWERAEKKSAHIQGTISHHIVSKYEGTSNVVLDSEVEFARNAVCGMTKTRVRIPESSGSKIIINNPQYFAIIETSTGVGRSELTFLDWLRKGRQPPVEHPEWNTTELVANFFKPYSFDKSRLFLTDLVTSPDFKIIAASLDQGLLIVDFETYMANKNDIFNDTLGGRLELSESLNWLPNKVSINSGSPERVVYFQKTLDIEYCKSNGDGFVAMPMVAQKTYTIKCVRPIPDTRLEPGIEEIHDIKMDLEFIDRLPPDKEFQLSAFGLPEPVRPQSMAATWWKWGGGMLVAGILFAMIAVKLGRKK